MKTRFEWDEAKAAINLRKHGIRFEDAVLAFLDPLAIFEQDREVDGEVRWQLIGYAADSLMLMVAHTVEEDGGDEVYRLISARTADYRDRRRYGKANDYFYP